MKTVVLGSPPAELRALIERRRASGLDAYDEVWEGSYHVAPMAHSFHGIVQSRLLAVIDPLARKAGLVTSGPFNIGVESDFRVPDGGGHRGVVDEVFVPTAAFVLEVVSPDDETYEKFDFYARRRVEEVLVAEPGERRVSAYRLTEGRYVPVPDSAVLGVAAGWLSSAIDWPARESAS